MFVMEQLSSNERTNLHINIYNNLTYSDFNDNGEEINFLESIFCKDFIRQNIFCKD